MGGNGPLARAFKLVVPVRKIEGFHIVLLVQGLVALLELYPHMLPGILPHKSQVSRSTPSWTHHSDSCLSASPWSFGNGTSAPPVGGCFAHGAAAPRESWSKPTTVQLRACCAMATAGDRMLYNPGLFDALYYGKLEIGSKWRQDLLTPGCLITDAKGMHEHVHKTGGVATEKQSALDILITKESLLDTHVETVGRPIDQRDGRKSFRAISKERLSCA